MILDSFSLKGKVAIVTGGNQGIGLAYVDALASAGADILVASYVTNVDEVEEVVTSYGRKVEFVFGDLSDASVRENVINTCVEKFGKIDILVNNAGTILRAPLLEYKDEDYEKVIELNLNAVYYLSQRASVVMAKQGHGKIINVASMLSFQGGKFVPSYTASKHGVAGLTKAFANELACENIQINAIAPGYIATENTAPIRADEERNKSILDRIPAGRWGDAKDLMGAVVFLASDASNYVNGHILAVDGGWLVR